MNYDLLNKESEVTNQKSAIPAGGDSNRHLIVDLQIRDYVRGLKPAPSPASRTESILANGEVAPLFFLVKTILS
ncbi:hypothetical protein [Scytonema sp. PCC 10023]|uniref:hypothetical protein n=1 Tax=Scytonema sp. PCC 10023 TaxID=1680591 RepID=UPI0039C5EE23